MNARLYPTIQHCTLPSASGCSWLTAGTGTVHWIVLIAATLLCATVSALDPQIGSDGIQTGLPAMAVILLAAILASIGGFSFSAIAGAVLFHLIPEPVRVVQIIALCGALNQIALTWAMRRHIEWRMLGRFAMGGLCGLPFGIWLLMNTDRMTYAPALGIILGLYGLRMILCRATTIRFQHTWLDMAAALLSGIAGGATAFPSIFVTMWVGLKGWDKERQRGLIQPFIMAMQVATALAITLVGHTSPVDGALPTVDVLYLPASLLGTAIGVALFRRMSDRRFTKVMNLGMITSGVSFLF
jgi:uncharacterized membrane protein YfcA